MADLYLFFLPNYIVLKKTLYNVLCAQLSRKGKQIHPFAVLLPIHNIYFIVHLYNYTYVSLSNPQ